MIFGRLKAALALSLAMLLGGLLGWNWRGSADVEEAKSGFPRAATITTPVEAEHPAGRNGGPWLPALQALRDAPAQGPEEARLLRYASAIDRLRLEEIPDALAYVETFRRRDRASAVAWVLARWGELDPAAVAQWLVRHPDRGVGLLTSAISTAVTQWAARDPTAARAWIEGLAGDDRREAFFGYFEALSRTAPAQGLGETAALPKTDRAVARSSLYEGWAEWDAPAAYRRARIEEPSPDRRNFLREIFSIWSGQDPAAALAALAEAQDQLDGDGPHAIGELLGAWVGKDAAGAFEGLRKLPESTQAGASRAMFESAFEGSPARALSLVEKLPPGPVLEGARVAEAMWLSDHDLTKAVALIRVLPEGPERDEVVERVAGHWSSEDPAAAGQWLLELPDASRLSSATQAVMRDWAAHDPQAAGAWLQRLAPGAAYDAAVKVYVQKVFPSDPAAALQWAASIGDPQSREAAVRHGLETWLRRDGTAAKTWLQGTRAIDPDLRSYFLRVP